MKKNRRQHTQQNPMAGEFAPPPERQFYAIGFICAMIQQTPEFIHGLMREAGVEYAYSQNGIGMIRGDDFQKMADKLGERRERVEADMEQRAQAATK